MDREKFLKKLGRQVAKVRASKGYSQDRIHLEAEKISRGTLSKLESGKLDPQIWTLQRIAETLGVSVKKLLDFEEG